VKLGDPEGARVVESAARRRFVRSIKRSRAIYSGVLSNVVFCGIAAAGNFALR
jgi:hypothetical protein